MKREDKFAELKGYVGLPYDLFEINLDMTREVFEQLDNQTVDYELLGRPIVTNNNMLMFVGKDDTITAIAYQHGFVYSYIFEDELYTISVLKNIQSKYSKIISSAKLWFDDEFNKDSLDE